MIRALGSAYGAVVAWRRALYARDPSRRRRLARPVVSVGNLGVGGSGKTPLVEYIARMLMQCGERPAVLTRGYARRVAQDGVTVVSDGSAVLTDVDHAGDEPLMLARALPGVAVLVGADRHLSGVLAERRFGVTVHLLDDGFQHLQLARDVDLLLVSEEDLDDRPLPAGRLRERLEAAASADAALVTAGYDTAAERIGRALRVPTVFRVTRAIAPPRSIAGSRDPIVVPQASRVFVVAGIARPERFIADVSAAGWDIAGTMTFRDHHLYGARDLARIVTAAKAAGSAIVLTTEKDAVRLATLNLDDLPLASLPLVAGVQPEERFRAWLLERLRAARTSRQPSASARPMDAASYGGQPR
ncbi:MAG TPA: tetraacyldisaccharide 4'-kinase [Vicinamibacterales bacterium]|nr:tetraacyldisaccharide 4'-kinase [Vicinamibacterales bacterium]